MRNKLIFCVSFFFLVGNLVAQNDDMVYDLNKSPEVVGFERQGRFNVNECSGSANINVPLHKIVYKDIELPLIINYNSKGVKVSSEASWVGLNWDLNIGGCVSVIPNGCFDYIDANSREQINKLLNKNNYNDYIEIIQDNSNEYSTTFHTLSELDFYSVTLPNANFYFFVDPETKNPTIIGSETDSYQIIRDSSVPSSLLTKNINGWTVKDGNGFTYEFTSIEKHDVRGNYEKYNVAWLLTKITSARGNHLNLKYTDTSVSLLPTKSETQDVYLDILSCGGLAATEYDFSRHTSFSNQTRFMTKPYLKSIETDDQIVEFNKSGRDDICGALKLDQVVVKSKLTNETIRTINFGYDYFDSNNVGGNYLLNKYPIESKYLAKRLKLESIEFIASDKQKQQYTFEYEESIGFPQKTSSAVDMWGYYNGQANSSSNSEYKHTMIPCAMYCDVPANYVTKSTISNHEGANRFADPTKTSAFILKKITYPTKGYTKFEYESNTFMKYYCCPIKIRT